MSESVRYTTILHIEDDLELREALGQALAREGYRVVGAARAEEALALLGDGVPVDLIVLDLMLEGPDGVEFRRRQLADPALAAIPVLLLTASPVLEVLRPLKGLLTLAKPADPAAVLAAVRRLAPGVTRPAA